MTTGAGKGFGDIYRGRRVLVTGHTGFKGSWLSCWLSYLEAKVSGLALAPSGPVNHWNMLGLDVREHRHDIRDAAAVKQSFAEEAPEIVFHLAAQPLVRRSYRDPLETLSTNVMGTAHVLEAARLTPSVRAVVCITTDKVYHNREWAWGYREDDRLGGHDIYSASKAAAELVAASYRKAFFHGAEAPLLATARAGNVIGGGDWSEDRLIPDLVRAVAAGKPLTIRSPQATRPWQHVLEPLSGYLMLGQKLLQGESAFAGGWNFGPALEGNRSVEAVLDGLQSHWPAARWQGDAAPQPHEARLLHLDSTKAQTELKWRPVWNFEQTLKMTASWYKAGLEGQKPPTIRQLADYVEAARKQGLPWTDTAVLPAAAAKKAAAA